mmetsp:Transcript_86188/g.175025  ORF Transcript_86188/g.175025 Transcript_86188/m.175025 type:complete len:244 (-) Transcript_86188:94-825(-)
MLTNFFFFWFWFFCYFYCFYYFFISFFLIIYLFLFRFDNFKSISIFFGFFRCNDFEFSDLRCNDLRFIGVIRIHRLFRFVSFKDQVRVPFFIDPYMFFAAPNFEIFTSLVLKLFMVEDCANSRLVLYFLQCASYDTCVSQTLSRFQLGELFVTLFLRMKKLCLEGCYSINSERQFLLYPHRRESRAALRASDHKKPPSVKKLKTILVQGRMCSWYRSKTILLVVKTILTTERLLRSASRRVFQ